MYRVRSHPWFTRVQRARSHPWFTRVVVVLIIFVISFLNLTSFIPTYGDDLAQLDCIKSGSDPILETAAMYFKGCPHIYNTTRGPLLLHPDRGEWNYRIWTEHAMVTELILCRVPFSFVRYGDGEYALMKGEDILDISQAKTVDKWSWKGGQGKLGKDLEKAIKHNFTNRIYIFGLPKPWTQHGPMLSWLVESSPQPTRYLSYAMLWGAYWKQTLAFFEEYVIGKKLKQLIIPIINEDAFPRKDIIKKWAHDIVFFPDDGPKWWESQGEMATRYYQSIARAYTGALFLVACGPVSEAIIFYMSEANPYNQYVDLGSAIERWTKGGSSRGYIWDNPEWEDGQYKKDEITGKVRTFTDTPKGESGH